ncbi:MAG TPA: GNAT family N-acetyltransferase [Acidimicrobiales bacterium]|nr:GNAT family N-acetyltransferase [Acidimicrobiales bacterium]
MIREATPSDIGDLLRLIRALAAYEKEPDAVATTGEDLQRALFGPEPKVFASVAEDGGAVVGMAVYFLTFSTWTGRHSLYLEDLFVDPSHRGRGLGLALLGGLARRAVELGCARMEWSVLDWNEPAIGFYRSLGARPMDEWTVFRLDGEALAAAAALVAPRPGEG